MFDLEKMTIKELLNINGFAIAELNTKGILQTNNNPVGDFAEYLFASSIGAKPEKASKKSYDVKDSNGKKYQVKARRTDENTIQFSDIRDIDTTNCFDFLIFVVFNNDYSIKKAGRITYKKVKNIVKPRKIKDGKEGNASIFSINLNEWNNGKMGDDITKELQAEFDKLP